MNKNIPIASLLALSVVIMAFVLPPTVDLETAAYTSTTAPYTNSELPKSQLLLWGVILVIGIVLPVIIGVAVNRKTYKEEKPNIEQ